MSEWPQTLLLAMMLVLPLTALVARRPPLGATVKMVVVWIVIFGVVAVAMTQIDRLQRNNGDPAQTAGEPVRISGDLNGYDWVDAQSNGIARGRLIASGAESETLIHSSFQGYLT